MGEWHGLPLCYYRRFSWGRIRYKEDLEWKSGSRIGGFVFPYVFPGFLEYEILKLSSLNKKIETLNLWGKYPLLWVPKDGIISLLEWAAINLTF
ncbi:MAG: hypothetical protein AAEI08_07880 [Gammaproteobacteria bacterium]